MLDLETIEKRLSGVPSGFVGAFAVRAAMRVLPAIVDKAMDRKPFGFWGNNHLDRALFSVVHTHRMAFCKLIIHKPSGVN